MTRRALACVLAAAALAVAACDVPTNDQPVELTGPFAQLETTTTTATTIVTPADSQVAVVYFLARDQRVTRLREVQRLFDVDAGVQEILANLFSQPPSDERIAEVGLTSAIPESAVLLSALPSAIAPDRLIVDVRGLIGSQGIQGADLRNALAQIVYTATEPGTGFREVLFRNDGAEADALVDDLETTSEPVDRDDYSRTS